MCSFEMGAAITGLVTGQPTSLQQTDSADTTLKLLAQGFTATEQGFLRAVVKVSQRRQPKLTLISEAEGENADVVLIDGGDAKAQKWASEQRWLTSKVVIWVDAMAAPGRIVERRPVQWYLLPMMLARVMEHSPKKTTFTQTSSSKQNLVLIVDDSLAVRNQLRSLLESRGLIVTDVDNAEDAIRSAALTHYGCILMDVLMSGTDGYEACRRIKANSHSGYKPAVVMLTSKTSPFDRIRGKMAGCDAYLSKPVDPSHLSEVISRYSEKHVTHAVKPVAGRPEFP